MLIEFGFRRYTKIYAIVETGSKQYRVSPGQTIEVEKLLVAEGENVELDKVLMVSDGEKTIVGTPTVQGAKVIATAEGTHKGKKIVVFRYKPKVRSRRKTGHRQSLTRLAIKEIALAGEGTKAQEGVSSSGA